MAITSQMIIVELRLFIYIYIITTIHNLCKFLILTNNNKCLENLLHFQICVYLDGQKLHTTAFDKTADTKMKTS